MSEKIGAEAPLSAHGSTVSATRAQANHSITQFPVKYTKRLSRYWQRELSSDGHRRRTRPQDQLLAAAATDVQRQFKMAVLGDVTRVAQPPANSRLLSDQALFGLSCS